MNLKERSLTILIVNNNITERQTLRQHLLQATNYQFNVVEASSGEEGLVWCRHQQPDAIVLDDLLPDLNSVEFLRRLIAQSNESPPPVILLVSNDESIAVQGIRSGAQGYLNKNDLTAEELCLVLILAILMRF
ncbi:MAG: response regulator [Hydrococcus sp. Prado102]|nr:response regulator [Hydrococcus sp. Prado102]